MLLNHFIERHKNVSATQHGSQTIVVTTNPYQPKAANFWHSETLPHTHLYVSERVNFCPISHLTVFLMDSFSIVGVLFLDLPPF